MWLVLLTIRACLSLYAGSLVAMMFGRSTAAKWLYAAAAMLYLAHVAAAFHFVHGWSHAAAHEHVARVTQAYAGVRTGAGLYLNYLLAVAWPIDAAYRLWACDGRRGRWVGVAMHGFLLFLAFNATVVFAPTRTRVAGAIAFAALLVAWRVARRRSAVPRQPA